MNLRHFCQHVSARAPLWALAVTCCVLPTSPQTTTNETTIAAATDKMVSGANLTRAIALMQADIKNPNFFNNNPSPRIPNNAALAALLALLQKGGTRQSVSSGPTDFLNS
ncbi:MAG TPA: hypothetical protein VKV32_00470 [Stellaceae bacterium]|nr:hypothetical protein [Stellaceae bacterium]